MRIAGIGCSLMDYLYPEVSFTSPMFGRYRSRRDGDGGLEPGKLVFRDDLERFSGASLPEIVAGLTAGADGSPASPSANLGGPSIVALINAAQLLAARPEAPLAARSVDVEFYGARGADETGERLVEIIRRTPVDITNYVVTDGATPTTTVLSDPAHDSGHGERTFIGDIGAAGNYLPTMVPDRFFTADVVAFGGTALVPGIHDGIGDLLRRAGETGAFTVVNTVYDFRSQQRDPKGRWPLGNSDETFAWIDLFIADAEEARRITGTSTPRDALKFLIERGVGAAIITQGSDEVVFYPGRIPDGTAARTARSNRVFDARLVGTLPVSERVRREVSSGTGRGDTTGCGDNFAGGVLASIAAQLDAGTGGHARERCAVDLREACAVGVVCGGYTCFYVGGTRLETVSGEKRSLMAPYFSDYVDQLSRAGIDEPPALRTWCEEVR